MGLLPKSKVLSGGRENYQADFLSHADKVQLIDDSMKKLQDLSGSFLKDYLAKPNKWDKAANALGEYSAKMADASKATAFKTASERVASVGEKHRTAGTAMMDKFNRKVHSFITTDVGDIMEHLRRVDSLRKEMDKTQKKADKAGDELTKNTAEEAKANHDKYVVSAGESMTNFLEKAGSSFFKDTAGNWVSAHTEMCNGCKADFAACRE